MGIFGDLILGIKRKPATPTVRAGVPGIQVYSGFLVSQERKASLVGRERYRTFDELVLNVPIVAAAIRAYLELVAKATWRVEPAEDNTPESRRVAELLEEVIHEMETPWSRIVRRAALFKLYGFSVQEWTAVKREDGAVGFSDIEMRPCHTVERWDLDLESGEVKAFVQRAPQDGTEVYLPRQKCVYLVDDSFTDSPDGVGLLRHVVQPAQDLLRFQQLEGWGYEIDLRGVPIGRAPLLALEQAVERNEISRAAADRTIAMMKSFIEDHVKNPSLGLLLDSQPHTEIDGKLSGTPQYGMELLSGASSADSGSAVGEAIQRKQREIARIFGAEHLLLGETGAGSLAMSRDKSQTFAVIVASALEQIAQAMDKDLVGPFMRLNGFDPENRPRMRPDAVQMREVQEITSALRDLAAAGGVMSPDDPAIDDVRELLGLPRRDPEALERMAMDASLLGGGGPPPGPPAPPGAPAQASPRGDDEEEPEVEDLVEKRKRTRKAYDESDHPRGESGRWTAGGDEPLGGVGVADYEPVSGEALARMRDKDLRHEREMAARGLKKEFDPDQERDEGGRWTEQGGGGATQELEGGKFAPMTDGQASRVTTSAKLDKRQKELVASYTTEGAENMNSALRERRKDSVPAGSFSYPVDVPGQEDLGEGSASYKEVAAILDRSLNGSRVARDVELYRGFKGGSLKDLKVGQTFKDYGYVSTSWSRGVASSFGERLAIIQVPAGSRSLNMSRLSNVGGEKEMLLPRGSRFQVVKVTDKVVTLRLLR